MVDGIDYARRFSQSNVASLFDGLPVSPPARILIVVSAQVTEQLPAHLQQLDQSRILLVPPLDNRKIRELLRQYEIIGNGRMQPYEEDDLCRHVANVTGGHALQVDYVARQLAQGKDRGIEPSETLSKMPAFDGDMEKYYQTILTRPPAALARQVLSLMASSPFELTAAEIAALLIPPEDRRQVEGVLDENAFMFRRTGRFLHFSHDSLRAFALGNSQMPGSMRLPRWRSVATALRPQGRRAPFAFAGGERGHQPHSGRCRLRLGCGANRRGRKYLADPRRAPRPCSFRRRARGLASGCSVVGAKGMS